MGKKRQSDDSGESNTPAKKEMVPEFNGTAFKAMLKEPSTAMKGEFIYTLKCHKLTIVVVMCPLINLSCVRSGRYAKFYLSYILSHAGLEAFISAAKKLPSSDVYDVVEGYIKISVECAEIFKLLEGEKHAETEVR